MKISAILVYIDSGSMALPEFQRGYVWNRNQVRDLMNSLYRKYPVGSLLIWETKTETATKRGDAPLPAGTVKLILDGQQRMTTLYGIIRGKSPAFFDGNHEIFTGLYFNIESESFEFYSAIRMKDNPLWVSVTELMQKGIAPFVTPFMMQLSESPELSSKIESYTNRMNDIVNIKETELHVEEVTGADKDIDVVVDIFNKVNSRGTRLSKGDLALAKVCAKWPEARSELQSRLRKWHDAGFNFSLDWLLRCVNTIATGEALFDALERISANEFRDGLIKAEKAIDYLLNLVSSRLGLDHDRVLGSRYAFPLMARYLDQRGGQIRNNRERDRLLFWYIHTLLWGRYSSQTETVLNQDLEAIEEMDRGLDRLIELLRRSRGNLSLAPSDFIGWSVGARFYPILYMLTRVQHALDLESGVELSSNLLGRGTNLHLHHIFPKSLLYEHGYVKSEVNQLANFTFLTQDSNLRISNQCPAVYLERCAKDNPGVLESHWIPRDPKTWEIENYLTFLDERRKILTAEARRFLDSLESGTLSDLQLEHGIIDRTSPLGGIVTSEEEQVLLDFNVWVVEQGLPEGEFSYELVDETTGELKLVLDLAWPEGIQQGYSEPVVLLIDEEPEVENEVYQAGFKFFTSPDDLKSYIRKEILDLSQAAD